MSIWSKIASYAVKGIAASVKGAGTASVATAKFGFKHPVLAGVAGIGAWATFGGDSAKSFGENYGDKAGTAVTVVKDFTKDAAKGFFSNVSEDQDVKDATNLAAETGKEVKDAFGGLGSMLGNVLKSIGGFFSGANNVLSGLTGGKMSGLGIAGLIASAYLVFGRSGLLGKIGGLMLGMALLSGMSRSETQAQAATQQRDVEDSLGRADTQQEARGSSPRR